MAQILAPLALAALLLVPGAALAATWECELTQFCAHQAACADDGPHPFTLHIAQDGSASFASPHMDAPRALAPIGTSETGARFYLFPAQSNSAGLLTLFSDGSLAIAEHFHNPGGIPNATTSHGSCKEIPE